MSSKPLIKDMDSGNSKESSGKTVNASAANPPLPSSSSSPTAPTSGEVIAFKQQNRPLAGDSTSMTRFQPSNSIVAPFPDAATIHLYNVPPVSDGYLLDLCSRWGPVASISRQISKLAGGVVEIVVTYHREESANEALRHLDGGTLLDCHLRAQSRSKLLAHHLESFQKVISPQEQAQLAAGGPRNLYVLNLSLEMTNAELERLFSVFGSSNTYMATGEAARQVINSLSGTTIQGYRLDVSFAIVQRSGGPVTDYPPTPRKRAQQATIHISRNPNASASAYYRAQIAMQQQPLAITASPSQSLWTSSNGTGGEMVPYAAQQPVYASPGANIMSPQQIYEMQQQQMMMMNMEAPHRQLELYVSNLDPVAILDDEDLANLFKPFGTVLAAQLAIDHNGHSMGVGLVRMSTAHEAELARTQVQGRVMDGKRISVNFTPPMGSPHLESSSSPYSSYPTPAMTLQSTFSSPMAPSPYMQPMSPDPMYQANGMYGYPVMSSMPAFNAAMAGLGIYDASSAYTYPQAMPTYSNPYNPYASPQMSTPTRFQPRSASMSSSNPDTSLNASTTHTATLSPIHSREASVETSATSLGRSVGSVGSNDVKIEEETVNSDGSGSASRRDLARSVPAGSVPVKGVSGGNGRTRSTTSEGLPRGIARQTGRGVLRSVTEVLHEESEIPPSPPKGRALGRTASASDVLRG